MKKRVGTVTVKLDGLKLNLFVRARLDEDHALYLAELLEGGVELPPILITEDKQVVEGRHRIEAHQLLNRTEIKAQVIGVSDETELIGMAYKANVGGSLPPTADDTEHTVMLLLQRGQSKKSIAELLGLPANMARRYVDEVKSRMNRAQLQQAVDAIAGEGLTIAKAADKYGVDPEKIKDILSVRRKRKNSAADTQRRFTTLYRSVGASNANHLRRLLVKYEDGDVSLKQMHDIFEHLEHLQKESARKLADWKQRFEAMAAKAAQEETAKPANP